MQQGYKTKYVVNTAKLKQTQNVLAIFFSVRRSAHDMSPKCMFLTAISRYITSVSSVTCICVLATSLFFYSYRITYNFVSIPYAGGNFDFQLNIVQLFSSSIMLHNVYFDAFPRRLLFVMHFIPYSFSFLFVPQE